MKLTRLFFRTMRETPSDADTVSNQLLQRAGFVSKQGAGIYSFMPLGYRTLRKIEAIIREEMESVGAQEIMPPVLPSENEGAAGSRTAVLAGTVADAIRSYRDLPLLLYRVGPAYRENFRHRMGIMHSREYLAADACSFDRSREGLDGSYKAVCGAYERIFHRLGLKCFVTSGFGGKKTVSQEFIAESDGGDAGFIVCSGCGYAARTETAECTAVPAACEPDSLMPEEVATPDAGTIQEVSSFLGCRGSDIAKTIIYSADGSLIAAMVRGDREISEEKLKILLGCRNLEMADAESVRKVTGAEIGFAGPVGLPVRIIADMELSNGGSFIVGANRTGYHLKHVVPCRDFKAEFADIRMIAEDDSCPRCKSPIEFRKGISLAYISKLDEKTAEEYGCRYRDESETSHPMFMGYYMLDIYRLMAAAAEQHHDENGIIWPMEIAPYQAVIVPVNILDEKQAETAEELYRRLGEIGAEVLLDDRNERAGVKFKDADLMGIPVRINIGRKAAEGLAELKLRNKSEVLEIPLEDAAERVLEEIGRHCCNTC